MYEGENKNNKIVITSKVKYDRENNDSETGGVDLWPIVVGNNKFLISYGFDMIDRENSLKIFDQILSTFEFK